MFQAQAQQVCDEAWRASWNSPTRTRNCQSRSKPSGAAPKGTMRKSTSNMGGEQSHKLRELPLFMTTLEGALMLATTVPSLKEIYRTIWKEQLSQHHWRRSTEQCEMEQRQTNVAGPHFYVKSQKTELIATELNGGYQRLGGGGKGGWSCWLKRINFQL